MWKTFFDYMNGTIAAIGRAQEANMKAALRGAELTSNTYARLWGLDTGDVIQADRRFKDQAWQENLPVDVM